MPSAFRYCNEVYHSELFNSLRILGLLCKFALLAEARYGEVEPSHVDAEPAEDAQKVEWLRTAA